MCACVCACSFTHSHVHPFLFTARVWVCLHPLCVCLCYMKYLQACDLMGSKLRDVSTHLMSSSHESQPAKQMAEVYHRLDAIHRAHSASGAAPSPPALLAPHDMLEHLQGRISTLSEQIDAAAHRPRPAGEDGDGPSAHCARAQGERGASVVRATDDRRSEQPADGDERTEAQAAGASPPGLARCRRRTSGEGREGHATQAYGNERAVSTFGARPLLSEEWARAKVANVG